MGIGRSIHAGQVTVADGTELAALKLERVLSNDPAMGVLRHVDAGYEDARPCGPAWWAEDPDGRGAARVSAVEGLLAELADVGRDPRGGYARSAWTRVDLTLREWFLAQAQARGLDVMVDRAGNQWAWWGDPDADGPGVVTGSHLDSVPGGGAYDGPLGVASAFAAVDALRAQGFTPAVPLGVVCFSDEEGARFGLACVGSRVATGTVSAATALGLRDGDGGTLADALRSAGRPVDGPLGLGPDPEAMARVGTFVELHVEQGRLLSDLREATGRDAPVAVGSGDLAARTVAARPVRRPEPRRHDAAATCAATRCSTSPIS